MSNTIPPCIRVTTVGQFKALRDHFKKECERNEQLQILPYDDPHQATIGYVVFTQPPKDYKGDFTEHDENPLSFELRFAARPSIDEVTREPFSEDQLKLADELSLIPEEFTFDKVLSDCITKDGVVRADDPKERRMGFALYGSESSVVHYFGLNEFKASDPELQKRVNKWREEHPEEEYRELAAKMLGEEECP
jgi:hypothetical protein